MKVMDYIYYCFYRYVLRTPNREAAEIWPAVFLGWTLWIHGLMAFWILTLAVRFQIPISPGRAKTIVIGTLFFLMLFFHWHYIWRNNAARVIQSFEKRENPKRYARFGAVMWYESLLLLFLVVGVLILSQKLTGWPPRP